MSEKEAYEKKLQAKLDAWSAEIDKLKAKGDEVEADLQVEYNRQLQDMRAMRDAAEQKLRELRASSDDAWEDFKVGIDRAWDEIANALRTARSRF